MKRSLLFVVVSALTAFGIGVAHGKDCQGVTFPEQAQVNGSTLTLNGLGLRQATFLKVNVYVAALYVANVSSDAQALLGSNTPKELLLHFLHNVSDDELKAACRERLSRYKVPKEFRLVSDLPRNRMGKIDRRALREPQGKAQA